jgi:hypothetical protein
MFHVNESGADRAIRIVVGFTLVTMALVYYDLATASPWGLVVGIVGAILLTTGVVGVDLIYALVGHQTKERGTMH